MYGFLAMLYNLICGSAAASDSVSKYQQSQRNLKEAIDRGDKVYEDAKGRMKTIGGDPAMEWFDERGHRVIINRANGRVIRDFDEERAEEEKRHAREWEENKIVEARSKGEKYISTSNLDGIFKPALFKTENECGINVWVKQSVPMIEVNTKKRYHLEWHSYYPPGCSIVRCKLAHGERHWFYKQYYVDNNRLIKGEKIQISAAEFVEWGGRGRLSSGLTSDDEKTLDMVLSSETKTNKLH